MRAVERTADAAMRKTIIEALMPSTANTAPVATMPATNGDGGGFLPVLPLVKLVVAYALPFRGVVTTVARQPIAGVGFSEPRGVCVFRAHVGRPFAYDPQRAATTVPPPTAAAPPPPPAPPLDDPTDPGASTGSGSSADGTELTLIVAENDCFTQIGFLAAARKADSGAPLFSAWTQTFARSRLMQRSGRMQMQAPQAVVVDPTCDERLYLLDQLSVRVLDWRSGSVSYVAGDPVGGSARAEFSTLSDLVCSGDGKWLYVSDRLTHSVRAIATATRDVTTITGPDRSTGTHAVGEFDGPESVAFDRTAGVKPDRVLFVACERALMRVQIDTGAVSRVKFDSNDRINPHRIVSLSNGELLVACKATHSLYAVDPVTRRCERLAGGGRGVSRGYADGSALGDSQFNSPTGMAVDDVARCVYVADRHNNTVRCVTLPPYLFGPSVH